MTDSGPPAPGPNPSPSPELTPVEVSSLATVDLSAPPRTVGGVIGRIVGGIVLMVVGLALALGALIGAVASPFFDETIGWADLIVDAAFLVVPLGFGLVIVGFVVFLRAFKRRAAKS